MKYLSLLSLFFLIACKEKIELDKQRAEELVRLNYRQQSLTEGAGKWTVYEVFIDSIIRVHKDTAIYRVFAHTNGDYKLPEIEDNPGNFVEKFYDTLQFTAKKEGTVWLASDWITLGARHE